MSRQTGSQSSRKGNFNAYGQGHQTCLILPSGLHRSPLLLRILWSTDCIRHLYGESPTVESRPYSVSKKNGEVMAEETSHAAETESHGCGRKATTFDMEK